MRVTNRMMADNAIQSMNDNLDKMNKLSVKVSTGKDFQYASEDPARASASLSLRSNLRSINAYAESASSTSSWMTGAETAFDGMDQMAIQAQDLMLQGLNDTYSPGDPYNAIASQIQTLLSNGVDLANTQENGQYIFSGFQINQKAFDLSPAAAPLTDYAGNPFTPLVATYKGDQGVTQRALGPDQAVNLNIPGDQAFQGVLNSLMKAYNALKQNNIHNTGGVNDATSLQTALGELQSSMKTMDENRATNGSRMNQVESASSFLDSVRVETNSMLSKKEDTNMAEGIALLENQKTTYQAVLQVSSRAISALSLFDYMQ